jgi:kumamolisin
MQPHFQKIPTSHLTGTHGHNGIGLAPVDIKTVYGLSSISLTGAGQTIALAEFDGYAPSDITTYENVYAIAPLIQVAPILVDGATNVAGANTVEVVLDIEMVAALAPGVSQILVYESPNSLLQGLDLYDRIATDNIAQVVSTSWGLDEQDVTEAIIQPESQIFQRMAIQGQSMYAASGDCGAYDQGLSGSCITNNGFRVDDPASQP